MTSAYLAPVGKFRAWDNNGNPLIGGQLFTYAAGSSTKIATYNSNLGAGGGTNANPIVLNQRAECDLWLLPNIAYKLVLAPANDTDPPTNPIWSVDQIVNAALITLFGGIDTGSTNAYVLTFASPLTGYANGEVIYWVPSNNNTGPSTINVNGLGLISIVNPNGASLGANQIIANQMTEIIYYNGVFQLVSLGNFTGSTIGTFGPETPLASAATTDLGTALAHVVLITGTTTITSFGSSASISAPIYVVRFNASLTVTYNPATLITPGLASIVTTAGDAAILEYLGGGTWKVLLYQYSTGSANTKIKPADTAITTSTTLTADPDLVTNTLAIGRYAFEIYLVFDSVTAGDGFKWTNVGTLVDSRAAVPTLVSGFVNSVAYGPKTESPYANTISYATVGNTANSNIVLYKGSLLVGTAGTFGVSWAKVANGASAATTLRAGSYITTTLLNTGASSTGLTHTFSAPGSGTETIPSGYNTLTIELWGASGGGGLHFGSGMSESAGGGGGSGGYCRTVITVTGLAGDTVPYTIGTGGGATVSGGPSTAGGGTLPISTMTANGGILGANATASNAPGAGGIGGTASGGSAANTIGNTGQAGLNAFNGGINGFGAGPVPGVFGSPSSGGGRGDGTIGPAQAGGNGLIIFSYSV